MIPEGFALKHNAVSTEVWHALEEWMRIRSTSTTTSGAGQEAPGAPAPGRTKQEEEQEVPRPGGEQVVVGGGSGDNDEMELAWEETEFNQNRPVAQFGFRYDYHNDVVVTPDCAHHDDTGGSTSSTSSTSTKAGGGAPPIPEIIQRLLLEPVRAEGDGDGDIKNVNFTQCIINDYKDAKTIIPWHRDDMAFGDVVLVYTFLDARPLHLRLVRQTHECCPDGEDGNNSSTRGARTDQGVNRNSTGNTGGEIETQEPYTAYYTAHPRHCSRYVLKGPARELWEHCVPEGKGRRISFTFRTLRSEDNRSKGE